MALCCGRCTFPLAKPTCAEQCAFGPGHYGSKCACPLHQKDMWAKPATEVDPGDPTRATTFKQFLGLAAPIAQPQELAKLWSKGARSLAQALGMVRAAGGAQPPTIPAGGSQQKTDDRLRADHPVVQHSARGSRDTMHTRLATEAGKLVALDEIDRLADAQSAARSAQERWETWTTAVGIYNQSPLPMTYEKVRFAAAALRAGGYRDARPYFDRAKLEHLKTYERPVGPLIELGCKKFCRAVSRGVGPRALKDAFPVQQLVPEQTTAAVANTCEPPWPSTMATLCSWWLLRGIEASAARFRDVSINHDRKIVSWTLPVSKTDVRALGATRTHACICADRPTLAHICPYHVATRHADLARALLLGLGHAEEDIGDLPWFPSMGGKVMSKSATIIAFRSAAAKAGEPTMRTAAGVEMQRYGEHACRVSGAQFMSAALELELYAIQLYGRWSSNAILRYVQEAPLARSSATKPKQHIDLESIVNAVLEKLKSADDSTAVGLCLDEIVDATGDIGRRQPQQIKEAVTDEVQISKKILERRKDGSRQLAISSTKRAHEILIGPEGGTPSSEFLAACGWRFGISEFQLIDREMLGDTQKRCGKCARTLAGLAALDDSSSDSGSD